jgi:hypothetical protein
VAQQQLLPRPPLQALCPPHPPPQQQWWAARAAGRCSAAHQPRRRAPARRCLHPLVSCTAGSLLRLLRLLRLLPGNPCIPPCLPAAWAAAVLAGFGLLQHAGLHAISDVLPPSHITGSPRAALHACCR